MDDIKLRICQDCLLADAGYETDNPLALSQVQGYFMGGDYDADDNDAHDIWADGYFSWGMCDGCGSTLGGLRWDMVAVKREG
jgi:hypothetical protein